MSGDRQRLQGQLVLRLGYGIDPDDGSYLNFVPSGTKISVKWFPELHDDLDRYYEWQNAVAQTVSYSAERKLRYGFIVRHSGRRSPHCTSIHRGASGRRLFSA